MSLRKSKTTEELTEEYEAQSMPTASRMNYQPPTGKEDELHTGTPDCYPCCDTTCNTIGCKISAVVILAVTCVCCCYVSDNFCGYWPYPIF